MLLFEERNFKVEIVGAGELGCCVLKLSGDQNRYASSGDPSGIGEIMAHNSSLWDTLK